MDDKKIPKGWKEVKIKEIGTVITGTTPSRNNPEYWGKETLFITPSDYKNYNKWGYNSERKLSKLGKEKLITKLLPPKSILITCIGSDMGKIIVNPVPAVTNQQINSIIVDNKKAHFDFIYYLLLNANDKIKMLGHSGGSALPILNKSTFENLKIIIPDSLAEQHAIASVLSSLDDKIDLLYRENKTLEQMAQAIFRKWFIEDAKDNWEEVKVGDKLEVLLGGTPSTKKPEYWNGNIPWINSGEINKFRIIKPTKYITQLGLKESSTKLLPKGTTVIAITGATLGQISRLEINSCTNQSVVGIIGNEEFENEYIYLWAKYHIKHIISNQTGGAQQHINTNDIKNIIIAKPDRIIYKQAMNLIKPLFTKISGNSFQILTLEKLRDTLLPKLISGEVRVEV